MSKVFGKEVSLKFNARFWLILCGLCVLILLAVIGIFSGNDDNAELTEEKAAQEEPIQKVYNFPPAEAENDLLKIATSVANTDKKICYLTFDDGPTKEVTPRVLEVLNQYDVKATFFVLGKMLEANREIGRQVFDEGHLLANHSYYHQYGELYATGESFMAEIEKTEQLICEVTGEEAFKLIRFPGGGHNAGTYAAQKQEYKQLLKEKGYYFVDWNCLNGDAEAALRSADELIARVKETAIGKNLVILMHDAAAKKTTPDALGGIIEYLRGQGYEFRRLDEIDYYADEAPEDEMSMIL